MRLCKRLQSLVWFLSIAVVVMIITLLVVTGVKKEQFLTYTTMASSALSIFSRDSPPESNTTKNSLPQSVPTLARIGSELEFNYTTCPPSSAMLNSSYTTPLHDDCPHVFIIGARKGGTTSLYHYLSSHPDFDGVRLDKGPLSGETFYFSGRYKRMTWSEYVSLFPADKMSGDSSVSNLVNCYVPERLYANCGRTAKVIVLLRDPVERFQSNFRMRAKLKIRCGAQTNISSMVDRDINRFYHRVFSLESIDTRDLSSHPSELRCLNHASGNMVFEGLYYVHLHNWLCNFPAENILILNTEQFHDHTVDSLAKVMEFVGLCPLTDDKMKNITSVVYNSAGRLEDELPFRKLSLLDKKKLMTIYEKFNNKLFQFLKWDSVKWNDISE